jgi:hypothetical protein
MPESYNQRRPNLFCCGTEEDEFSHIKQWLLCIPPVFSSAMLTSHVQEYQYVVRAHLGCTVDVQLLLLLPGSVVGM